MAAGGFKTFTTGEVLTSADTNNFLMQGVLVFDDATARDAAITAPVEGQVVYLKDTNQVSSYDGSTYVAVGGGSPLTTKGDLYTFSTVDARLPVGTDGFTLVADSSTATGLAFAAPAAVADNYTLINAGGTALTGAATITVSGISGKNSLFIWVEEASSASASSFFNIRFNADSGSNYRWAGLSLQNVTMQQVRTNPSDTEIEWARQATSAANLVTGFIRVDGTNATGQKPFSTTSSAGGATPGNSNILLGTYFGGSAITSVSIISTLGNFDSGNIYVYGA